MFVNISEPYYRGHSGITCYDIKVHGSDETEQETEENGKAKKIISKLCDTIRFLNRNDNNKLTDVDDFLKEAEDFIK